MNEIFRKHYPEFRVIDISLRRHENQYYFAAEKNGKIYLVVGNETFSFFEKQEGCKILRKNFSYLNPVCAGKKNSFGFGDRTGFATPGHIRAAKKCNLFPIFAQQSARELERTGRTFQKVLDDAVFWCLVGGWSEGFGADCDHAKSFDVLEKAISAGYTFFTIDPSDKIKEYSADMIKDSSEIKFYFKEYSGKTFSADGFSFVFTEDMVFELAVTYGKAIDFIEDCYKFINEKKKNFDFEVSVDETKIPTTPYAHAFIVMELIRRKINFQSLALRFPGHFEKGIDYKGNIEQFEMELKVHNSIRRRLGPYKISLHSGSDKFSIYRQFKEILGDMFHIKTSGTSWIQAMKTIAVVDRDFFIECIKIAVKDFEKNSASYEISTDISKISIEKIKQDCVDDIFSDNNIRQLIHISYGSILGENNPELKNKFYSLIEKNLPLYTQFVEEHLQKHISLLSKKELE